eukprot:552688-Amphidinium_carterae.1
MQTRSFQGTLVLAILDAANFGHSDNIGLREFCSTRCKGVGMTMRNATCQGITKKQPVPTQLVATNIPQALPCEIYELRSPLPKPRIILKESSSMSLA